MPSDEHYMECSTIEHYEDPNMNWRGSFQRQVADLYEQYSAFFLKREGYLPNRHSERNSEIMKCAREDAVKRIERSIIQYDHSTR